MGEGLEEAFHSEPAGLLSVCQQLVARGNSGLKGAMTCPPSSSSVWILKILLFPLIFSQAAILEDKTFFTASVYEFRSNCDQM